LRSSFPLAGSPCHSSFPLACSCMP
jgi:hypothetical protein